LYAGAALPVRGRCCGSRAGPGPRQGWRGSLGLAPSTLVDIGVHTIILDTVAYAELCDRFNGGHFLHHVPKVEM
jgi:hypothetical protein